MLYRLTVSSMFVMPYGVPAMRRMGSFGFGCRCITRFRFSAFARVGDYAPRPHGASASARLCTGNRSESKWAKLVQQEQGEQIILTHEKLTQLGNKLQHEFKDLTLLANAMVHKSITRDKALPLYVFAEIRPGVIVRITEDNDRLELLGDRVIGLIAAEKLYWDGLSENQISSAMNVLVSNSELTRYCTQLDLVQYLTLGVGGSLLMKSNLPGEFLEACFGAVYIDGGLKAAKQFFTNRILPLINVPKHPVMADPKRVLQEHLVSVGLPGHRIGSVLQYKTIKSRQSQGTQSFTRAICIYGRQLCVSEGPKMTTADQQAASELLQRLQTEYRTACLLTRLARNARDDFVFKRANSARLKLKHQETLTT